MGALIASDGKYLLVERAVPPPGFAGVAGHVDEGETPDQALAREVQEEISLTITSAELLLEEMVDWNWCSKGVTGHYWYLYRCAAAGEMKRSFSETKSAGWYSKEEIGNMNLEPVWKHWFERLNII